MIKFLKILLVIFILILVACIGYLIYISNYKDYEVEADDKLEVNIDVFVEEVK